MQQWQPQATWQIWKQRQDLVRKIRSFFMQKQVEEVDVPVLACASGTDPHLDYFSTQFFVDGISSSSQERYLVTSPEFYLKRCLAAGFGDLYYLGKAFRNGECGKRHNPEFTLLEWYRVGWKMPQLIQEVAELVQALAQYCGLQEQIQSVRQTRWLDAYRAIQVADPLQASEKDFQKACLFCGVPPLEQADRETWLDYLMVTCIEPRLGQDGLEFLVDYPPHHAALAEIVHQSDGPWALRFELYWQGIELANGYQELVDASEQRKRFEQDLDIRRSLNKRTPALDEQFLAALKKGLPFCSGVALGVDRLIMLLLGQERLGDVLLFPDPGS